MSLHFSMVKPIRICQVSRVRRFQYSGSGEGDHRLLVGDYLRRRRDLLLQWLLSG